jgi:hypothetical protein
MTTGCWWPLPPQRPPRDGAFFVRSPAGALTIGGTKEKAPGLRRGLMLKQQVQLTGWPGGWLRHSGRW